MRVQRVLSPSGGAESWTLIGQDRRPVAPVEAYLAWLARIERSPNTVRAYAQDLKAFARIERSPNTVRAYAQDLKAFWEFLTARGLAWDRQTLEQLGLFTAWLRQPADNVVLLAGAEPRRAATTVNRMLSAVMGFYDFHARHGVEVARALVDRSRSGRGSYKPFLDGIAPARDRAREGRLREPRRPPRTLSLEQVAAVLDAQRRLRDRFLFALLFGTGMRIGQALGLRHADFVSHERRVEIVARENANGARGKGGEGSVPISGELVRLHSDYMHEEYGELDSDYVFVNLWAGQRGRPMRYPNVVDVVERTRRRVGFHFTAHMFRHTYATLARRGGVPLDIVSRLRTHGSVQTTSAIYCHASPEDLRAELERAGVLDQLAIA